MRDGPVTSRVTSLLVRGPADTVVPDTFTHATVTRRIRKAALLAELLRSRIAGFLIAIGGLLAAVSLPFAPVYAETATVTWPAATGPASSTSALFVPYRPVDLTAELPCSALRWTGASSMVLATGAYEAGLTVTTIPTGIRIRSDAAELEFPVSRDVPHCRVTIQANSTGLSVAGPAERVELPGWKVPRVFAFLTDLDTASSVGVTVTAHTRSPFATSPTPLKTALIVLQLLCVLGALVVLGLRPRWRISHLPARLRPRQAWWIDAGVIVLLGGWAVVGPMAVDDGWATTIARTFADTGTPGNFYRWWNSSEVPFALSQEVLSRFTEVSVAPLWLRVPSTLLGVATWLVLSRGILGAALPVRARTTRVRLLAAIFFLAAWLPFNLGTRPESYVALGLTLVTALLWRSRKPAGIGLAAIAVALTVPVSPTAVLLTGPVVVLFPRALAVVRRDARDRLDVAVRITSIACIAAMALTVVFGDQTWDALRTATDWHTFFGPTLPWSSEPDRYHYLLGDDQQGSFAKRAPVLIAVAMMAAVAAFTLGRTRRFTDTAALRLGTMVVIGLAALAVVPSKWSYHLGAAAGLLAAFSTVAVVLVRSRARASGARFAVTGLVSGILCACAAALAFTGPNAWWLSTAYDVPWSEGPVHPFGLPLNSPLLWLVAAAIGGFALTPRSAGAAARSAPAMVAVLAAATSLLVLVGSFVAAPVRRPEGSLALANLNRLHEPRDCALADDIEVLPDGPTLDVAGGDEVLDGFAATSGYYTGAPPPDQPGTGTSRFVWGSRATGPETTGELVTQWFELPPLASDTGVAVSVSGRIGEGNALVLEYGRVTPDGVAPVGEVAPADRIAIDEDPGHPLWRTVGVDADSTPAGADRVRIRAVDGRTDELGWLAVTGPRLRSIIGLNDFLASRGPVLVAWPQSFAFPCVIDIPRVAAGMAQTPDTVIESPRPYFAEDRDENIGGSFAGVAELGDLQEVTTRLRGHPDVDWGSVRVWTGAIGRDRYGVTVERIVVAGAGGTPRPPPERP